jgi:ribosomal protein S27AE
MRPKRCPKCPTWLSEDEETFYCTNCDFEEFKIVKVKYKEEI